MIGVAVFDEKVVHKPIAPIVIEKHIHHHDNWPWHPPFIPYVNPMPVWSDNPFSGSFSEPIGTLQGTFSSSGPVCSVNSTPSRNMTKSIDVGTAYGQEIDFHTATTSFERATAVPAMILTLHYATRERLKKMGVNFTAATPAAPNPFPAQIGAPGVPAPPGWRG